MTLDATLRAWADATNAALPGLGAASFGAVIGWITHRTIRRMGGKPSIADVGAIVTTLLGAAVTAAFQPPQVFGAYSLGLGAGFFGYLAYAVRRERTWIKAARTAKARGERPPVAPDEVRVDVFLTEGAVEHGAAPPPATVVQRQPPPPPSP